MCMVSAVGDNWKLTFPDRYPNLPIQPFPYNPNTPNMPNYIGTVPMLSPSRQEFDALKAEMEELKKMLLAAKRYDEATGQADCETDEKVALIKQVAKMVGVDMKEVFHDWLYPTRT